MVRGNHWYQWFFDGFEVRRPLVSMVYNGFPPLVQRWNGCLPSLKSNWNVDQVGFICLRLQADFKRKLWRWFNCFSYKYTNTNTICNTMVSTFDKLLLVPVSCSLLSQCNGLQRLKFPKRSNWRQFIALLTSPRPSLLPKLLDPCTIYCPTEISPSHSFDREGLKRNLFSPWKLAPSCRFSFHFINPTRL